MTMAMMLQWMAADGDDKPVIKNAMKKAMQAMRAMQTESPASAPQRPLRETP